MKALIFCMALATIIIWPRQDQLAVWEVYCQDNNHYYSKFYVAVEGDVAVEYNLCSE